MAEPQVKTSKMARWLKLLTTEFLLVLLLLGGALLALYFAIDIAFSNRREFDKDVFVYLSNFVTPARTQFMLVITQMGNHKFLVPANLLLLAYFLTKKIAGFPSASLLSH